MPPVNHVMLQDSLTNSAATIKSAVEGQAGVLAKGSTPVSPGSTSSRSNEDSNGLGAADSPPAQQLRFRGLEPSKRYVISLCTESNSGTLSGVTVAEAEAHAEAPLVRPVGYLRVCNAIASRISQGGYRRTQHNKKYSEAPAYPSLCCGESTGPPLSRAWKLHVCLLAPPVFFFRGHWRLVRRQKI